MSTDSMQRLEHAGERPTGAPHLGLVRDQNDAGDGIAETEQLRMQLATAHSAGRALIVAMGELERRLDGERSTSSALRAHVSELERMLDVERAQARDLQRALEHPDWRKLVGRQLRRR